MAMTVLMRLMQKLWMVVLGLLWLDEAHLAVSVGPLLSAIAIIGLVILYFKRRPNEMVSNTEKNSSSNTSSNAC